MIIIIVVVVCCCCMLLLFVVVVVVVVVVCMYVVVCCWLMFRVLPSRFVRLLGYLSGVFFVRIINSKQTRENLFNF